MNHMKTLLAVLAAATLTAACSQQTKDAATTAAEATKEGAAKAA